ncbi:MAG: hypothetical protein ACFFE3_03125 [Candidatus Thorarchaeota archaeon]
MVDHTTQGASNLIDDDSSDSQEFELAEVSERSERTRRIAVGAILASISVAVAPSVGFIARVAGWGIAFFDHVSIFWMVSFLIGGPLVGSISLIAGGIALFPFDPFSPFGPVFKIIATLPMMVVPYYGVRRLKSEGGGETLSRPRFYATLMVLAFILRLSLMIPINLAYGALFAPFMTVEFILNFAIILNASQSIWDALIPFVIVHPTGLFKHFKMW